MKNSSNISKVYKRFYEVYKKNKNLLKNYKRCFNLKDRQIFFEYNDKFGVLNVYLKKEIFLYRIGTISFKEEGLGIYIELEKYKISEKDFNQILRRLIYSLNYVAKNSIIKKEIEQIENELRR